LKKLVEDMFQTMYDARGVGLAAPQVGVSRRIFVMDCSGGEDPAARVALINPEVLRVEGEQNGEKAACPSPHLLPRQARLPRSAPRAGRERRRVRVRRPRARSALHAHETDHCDGVVFIDRTTALKRELVKRKIKKLSKAGKWV
jgi:peptide deformylase